MTLFLNGGEPYCEYTSAEIRKGLVDAPEVERARGLRLVDGSEQEGALGGLRGASWRT